MLIRIKKASKPTLWYAAKLGKLCQVERKGRLVDQPCYMLKGGLTVLESDAEVVPDNYYIVRTQVIDPRTQKVKRTNEKFVHKSFIEL